MELTDGPIVPVFCTDIPHHVGTGDTFVASDEEMDCRVKWLLTHYPSRLTTYTPWPDGAPGSLSDRYNEMAARQAAVWHFSDGLDPDVGTTIGARAWEIIDVVPSDACAADAPSVAITPASTVNPINTTQTFTVTVTRGGEPVSGQEVNLSADLGALSADAITTDDQGQATFTLTYDMPDTTSNIDAEAEMSLPVGTIFVGTEENKQKLVLGEETTGSVYGSATATWTGTGAVTTISFDDYNMNEAHDAGEPLLEGWTVTLYKENGASWDLIGADTTDSAGMVSFTGLSAGDYRVVENMPAGWYNTTSTDVEFTLAADESQSVAFGQVKLPVIVGHVFQDDDLDGAYDASEPSLSGWELRLYRMDGSYIAGMQGVTGDDGTYIFSAHPDRDPPDIVAGDYFVQETLPEEWYATTGVSETVTVGSGDIGHAWLGNIHPEPSLTLEKDGPATAHEGDEITYDFAVTNDGNVPLENVTVNDPLLGGEVCDLGTLGVGASATCDAAYTIPDPADDPLENTATASGAEPYLGGEASDTASASTDILNPPEAEDDSAETDEDIAVTVDVLDNDSDPDGDDLTVDSVTQPAHGTVTNNGTDVTYTPDDDYSGFDSFTYTVSDGNGSTDTATVNVTVFDLDISIDASGPAQAHEGDTITYTVTVSNDSEVPLDVSVPLPDGGTWTDTLDVGSSTTFETSVVAGGNDLSETFTATGSDPVRGGEVSASDTVNTDILHPTLNMALTPSAAQVYVNSPVILTYEATNAGDATLYNVTITSDNGTPSDPSDDHEICSAAELGVGETLACDEIVVISEDTTYTATGTGQDTLSGLAEGQAQASITVTSDDDIPDDDEENNDTDGDGVPDYLDSDDDNDGIPDDIEGDGDADGDGTPNFLDLDSDGDSIPDEVEGAGDADGDGTPNFLDTDSDGDGIPDEIETAQDADGDGTPNFLDTDSDGDGIPDEIETAQDADGDGTPNFLDLDSDGDGIPDETETAQDADGDGTPNFLDLDSDGDGIPDAGEWSVGLDDPLAGCTADDPICYDNDADGDGVPNYLDADSDNDGISDEDEGVRDSDNDGIPDWLDPDPAAESDDHYFYIYLPTVRSGH